MSGSSDALRRADEWQVVIHRLHVFQAALTAFRAALSRLDRPTATPGDAHEPLREWLLCQAALDALPDMPEGEPHVVRLSVLRREMEERLREEMWSVGGLLECTAELDQACAAYLTFADRHLRRALDAARREEPDDSPTADELGGG